MFVSFLLLVGVIEKLNCCICLHGMIKASETHIDQYFPNEICDDALFSQCLIYGCEYI